jgi:hypothetical protein
VSVKCCVSVGPIEQILNNTDSIPTGVASGTRSDQALNMKQPKIESVFIIYM